MTTTWATTNFGATATCSSGTEAAPNADTDGFALAGVASLTVVVESTADAFSSSSLLAYLLAPGATGWARLPSADVTVPAGSTKVSGGAFEALVRRGRVAWVPNGLGQPCKVLIVGNRWV